MRVAVVKGVKVKGYWWIFELGGGQGAGSRDLKGGEGGVWKVY